MTNHPTPKTGIAAVASLAGVSATTVSQILNGKGQRFSAATRQKVLAARDQLGYVPNYNARTLKFSQTQTVGVLVPNLANPFFAELISHISNAAREHHFVAVPLASQNSKIQERKYLAELLRRSVDGIIVAGSVLEVSELRAIITAKKTPFLLLDQVQSKKDDQVIVDEYAGGCLAAKHLLANQHRQVVMVAPKNAAKNVQLRLAGFADTIKQAGGSTTLIDTPLSKIGGYLAGVEVLATKATAAFAANDEVAVGLMRSLAELGVSVGSQFSVMGYDDIDWANYVTPGLTTIAQPKRRLGQLALATLVERINAPTKAASHHCLQPTLIVRASTAPKK